MPWFPGEPSFEEVLADPVVRALMRSDGVSPAMVRALATIVRLARSKSPDPGKPHQGSAAPS